MNNFEDKLVEAVVRQWFDPTTQVDQFGNTVYYAQPATKVAAELLRTKEGELVKAIVAKLDLKKLAQEAADIFFKRVVAYDRWDATQADSFQQLVSEKIATMMAEKIMAEQEAKQ
jgi:hypothetical protein